MSLARFSASLSSVCVDSIIPNLGQKENIFASWNDGECYLTLKLLETLDVYIPYIAAT